MALHVLIAGAGVGGLALAQGLRGAGIDVSVFEADPSPDSRRQGYRLHIDADGGEALRRCLPDPLYRLYLATSNRTTASPRISGMDHRMQEVFARDVGGSEHSAVNRLTLRQILLTGLADIVHFGRRACGADVDDGGVTLRFTDGGTARGDVLVAADGVSSFLRPGAHVVVDTGLRVVYGRTTLTPERMDWLPERFFAGFTAVMGPSSSMAAGAMRQRRPVTEAVAEFAPGAHIDPFADYLMWAMVAPGPRDGPALDLADGWHPVLRRLITEADPADCFPIAIHTCLRVPDLPTGRATLLGDAIHPMTPAAGSGANTALRDAALLTDLLAAGRADPVPALTTYAERMRRYATDAVHLSLRNSNLEHLLP